MIGKGLDRLVEGMSRRIAQRSSRRSFVSRLGMAVAGGVALPILPVDRRGQIKMAHAEEFAKTAQTTDMTACNYWRYCSSDGYLCSCCGGTYNQCPPGSQPSPTSWVGTCINPDDGQAYLIAYRDCCGKDSCGQCACLGLEGEYPSYRSELNNDIIWCFGAPTMVYHCSSAVLIGKA
ncbi:methylamine dehydrogenase (amicyanin) small subunit [Marinimicrococcus flavescens]|uniref:Methylamine dehydrogenase (amicyanin) n=1 Tax=Marinimicrococcus flavescens TaxID=3031815 RepID=A0AAP3UY00_9PROT|nr:methylamine dehydrogenase (amicyanin) small subunit [Marinimicrococcus flavescens]